MIRPTDSELLMRFTHRRDEEAFRLLVERHAPLVQTVCDRVLHNHHDVEDAFQATFLVLARRARSIRCRDSVASWLFKVAHRTAVHAAMQNKQRPTPLPPEKPPMASAALHQRGTHDGDDKATSRVLSQLERRETFERLVAELNRLPNRYRQPLMLFYLEGKSRRTAAEELDCSEAALKARLARGRRLLRSRLLRRGISLSLAFAVLEPGTESAEAATATALIDPTVTACLEYAATGKAGSACSAHSVSLAEGVPPMSTFTLTKTTVAAGLLAAAGLLTLAVIGSQHLAAQSNAAQSPGSEETVQTTLDASDSEPKIPQFRLLAQADGEAITDQSSGDAADDQTEDPRLRERIREAVARALATGLKDLSPIEQDIYHQLEAPTDIEFIDTPLRDVMDYLSDLHDIPIRFQTAALQEEGITTDEPVNVVLTGPKLESVLNIILQDEIGGLTYIVEDEVMKITTELAAERKFEPRVYPVQNLLDAGFEPEELEQLLMEHVQAETVQPLSGFLVITHSQPGHRRTAELLQQLHRAAQLNE